MFSHNDTNLKNSHLCVQVFIGLDSNLDDDCLIDDNFNDNIISLKIQPYSSTFFKHASYGGTAINLPEGNYTLQQLNNAGLQDKDLSSFKVAQNYQVILYENDNFSGKRVIFNSDQDNLGSFNDKTSSISIKKIVASVYKHASFSPIEIKLAEENYTTEELVSLGINDNDISSLKITSDYQITLFDKNNFSGDKFFYHTDQSSLTAFNDRTSSIRIQPTVASIFKHADYGGDEIKLAEGTYTTNELKSLGMSDNDISSLKVKDKYQIVLFDGNSFTGSTATFKNSQTFLSNFNDKTSSLKVEYVAAEFFKHSNYGGTSATLGEGSYTTKQLEEAGITNNDISSFKINPNYKVTLYDDDNFKGTNVTYTSEQSQLGNFNDKTSSLKIEKINLNTKNAKVSQLVNVAYEEAIVKDTSMNTNPIENINTKNATVSHLANLTYEEIIRENTSIYPNPAEDFVNIKSSATIERIEIYSIDGKAISSVQNINSKVYKLNVQNLPSGTYLITLVYINNNKSSYKIFKI